VISGSSAGATRNLVCWCAVEAVTHRISETLINQLLVLAVMLSGLFALVSPLVVFVYVFAPLVERLVSPTVYRWAREIDSNHLELAVSVVHVPLLSGGAAGLASIGTNAITDSDANTLRFWYGIGFIAVALIALAGGGTRLLRAHRTSRPWLTRVRLQLRKYAELQEAPDDLSQVRARVERLQRVGQRMIDNADALTLRRWVRLNRDDARSIGGMWLGNLAALVVIVAGLPQITPPPATSHLLWYTTVPLALGVIALPLGLLIQRNLRRWWLRRFGTELISETARAEKTLRRITPTPAPATIRARIHHWWRRRTGTS
jgi:hypothetical protein